MSLLKDLREKCKECDKKIVLPESEDERVLKAANILKNDNIAEPILVGDKENINNISKSLDISLSGIEIISPESYKNFDDFVDTYYNKRKHKDIDQETARERMKENTFFGAMLVEKDLAHGCVSGANTPTGGVLRPALHIIGTADGVKTVSSDMLMVVEEDNILSFSDCAVLPDPNPEQLAEIAIATANTHKSLVNEDPKVAMLSFSTKGSSKHEKAEKVIKATKIVKDNSNIEVDGEMQADAAIVQSVADKKAPDSSVAGQANVLIFPDLGAGNIGYKLVQRIANIEAIGPIIQGLAKPMNDLSRGCSVDDIVNVSAILCNIE